MSIFNFLTSTNESITIIKPETGWQVLNFSELKGYKDLIGFLVWRNIKVLYAQTILGLSWAILEPLIQILFFTVIFGKVARIETNGIPYFLFSTVAIVPWSYLSQAMTQSSDALISGQNLLAKVYFPRLIFPLVPAFSKLFDFTISMFIVLAVLIYFHVTPTPKILFFPLLVFYMVWMTVGFGTWTSALAIRFRDIRRAMPFFIRMLMYTAPVIYPLSSIPDKYRLFYSINPLVGIIEGFRACLLGTEMPLIAISIGMLISTLLFFSGSLYFRKVEKVFVDVL